MSPSELRAAAERIRRIRACVEKSQDIYGVVAASLTGGVHEAARIIKRRMLDDQRALVDAALEQLFPADDGEPTDAG